MGNNKVESVLTLAQVSRLLDIPEEMVNQWSDDGIINCCFNNSGGEKLFRLRDIAHFSNILKVNEYDERKSG
jgi:DNA-binding transcriptional MerR regulator